jgi:NAD(P)-dependent dehydrogenase (short-subunit alcohol dehydrogenase family)
MAAQEFNVDSYEFASKRVLITSSTKGIGRAVVARFRDGGARAHNPQTGEAINIPARSVAHSHQPYHLYRG